MAHFSWAALAAAVVAVSPAGDSTDLSARLDKLAADQCQSLKLPQSPTCDDATFVRRVWLDLAGRVPPAKDALLFLGSQDANKRQVLVDQLLDSPGTANHWGRLWAEFLTDQRPFDQNDYSGKTLQHFLRDAWLADTSYRDLVSQLLQGDGPSDISGPANFLLRYNAEPQQLAGALSKKFLGVTLHCAECHDHPHASWKQDDFWGLAAFFARLRRMQPTDEPEGDNFAVVFERQRGELHVPDPKAEPDAEGNRPMRTIYPRLPGGRSLTVTGDRRRELIRWLTAESNPYFARHFVNRAWLQFFGTELTGSLDAASAKPTETVAAADTKTKILELLAADFAASGHDMQRLVRGIVLSQTYQRSAGPPAGKSEYKREELEQLQLEHFARARLRPLTADQILLSIAQCTGFTGDDADARLSEMAQDDYSYDLATATFSGQSQSLLRSLAMLNGDHVRAAAEMASTAATRLYGNRPGAHHVQWLFAGSLSRQPTSEELDHMLELAGSHEDGLQDVAWVLLNSAEFNTNH